VIKGLGDGFKHENYEPCAEVAASGGDQAVAAPGEAAALALAEASADDAEAAAESELALSPDWPARW
jgi:hypothetical protein